MKNIPIFTISSAAAALLITSCQNPGTPDDNPYNAPAAPPLQTAPAADPYAVPQTGTTINPNGAPYQPLPGLPPQSPSTQPYAPTAPAPNYGATAPAPDYGATATTHTVVSGDSLWGLSRKYNVSVEAIQAANGLSDTVIRTGQTLNIPAN